MAKLKSELEVHCPCCDAVLVIDTNLRRVVSHHVPERGNAEGRDHQRDYENQRRDRLNAVKRDLCKSESEHRADLEDPPGVYANRVTKTHGRMPSEVRNPSRPRCPVSCRPSGTSRRCPVT